MKYFRMSYEEVVFNRSYLNIILLNRSIPPFGTDGKEGEDNGIKTGKNRNNQPSKVHREIDKPISANDFFMGMMG